jgi:hypothetical protein
MMEQNARPARKVGIADHIWEAFEEMARTMGSDRDALINQAMFMFARLNGFLDGGAPSNGVARSGKPVLSQVPGGRGDGTPMPAAVPARASPRAPPPPEEKAARLEDDPVRREVAERVLETAAELERLIKGKNQQEEGGDSLPDVEDAGEVQEPQEAADGGPALYLMAEGGEMDKIAKDRFVIGRGKHCDFVINSGKVSREHAVIMRDGGDYYIEDLGSSNGTWYNKQRIKRRKIEDGDEYYICSEKIKLVMR